MGRKAGARVGAKGVGAKVEGPVEAREEGVMAVVLVEAMEAAVMGGGIGGGEGGGGEGGGG